MNFLNKIFNRTPQEFKPTNRLEELLKAAALDPGLRPDFLRQLFHFELIVIGTAAAAPGGETNLKLRTDDDQSGNPFIYAFTSVAALQFSVLKNKMPGQEYVGLKAKSLFEMLSGNTGVHLNLGVGFGKDFTASEIKDLLEGKFAVIEENIVKVGETIAIGIPAKIPEGTISALKSYVRGHNQINDIYFGLMNRPSKGFSYYVAVEFADPTKAASPFSTFNDLGMITQELEMDYPVDMVVAGEKQREYMKAGSLLSVNRS